jgi:cytochrome P450 family 619
LPIIGNLHQLPQSQLYLTFANLAKRYGEMYSLKIGSMTFIVLSSRKLVKEVLERKSVISSGRMYSYALEKLIFQEHFMTIQQSDNPMLRVGRKLLHQYFGDSAIDKGHLEILNAEATQLLRDLMVDPENFRHHFHRYGNSFAMSKSKL